MIPTPQKEGISMQPTPYPPYDNPPLANHAMWPAGESQEVRDLYDAQQGSKAGAR